MEVSQYSISKDHLKSRNFAAISNLKKQTSSNFRSRFIPVFKSPKTPPLVGFSLCTQLTLLMHTLLPTPKYSPGHQDSFALTTQHMSSHICTLTSETVVSQPDTDESISQGSRLAGSFATSDRLSRNLKIGNVNRIIAYCESSDKTPTVVGQCLAQKDEEALISTVIGDNLVQTLAKLDNVNDTAKELLK